MTLSRGAMKKDRPVLAMRELTREDLPKLKVKRTSPIITRFRDPHHNVARLLAMGLRTFQVAERTGYSHSRILAFSADPAFNELIARYREQVTEQYKESVDDYMQLATSNMLKAERMIAEKLDEADENNELPPTRELIAISRDAADRFGYGKRQMNVNVNVDFASQLEKAIARSGKTIDANPVKGPRPLPAAPVLPTPVLSQGPIRRL